MERGPPAEKQYAPDQEVADRRFFWAVPGKKVIAMGSWRRSAAFQKAAKLVLNGAREGGKQEEEMRI